MSSPIPEWWLRRNANIGPTVKAGAGSLDGEFHPTTRFNVFNPSFGRLTKRSANDAYDNIAYSATPFEGPFSVSFAHGRGDVFVGLSTAVPDVGSYISLRYSIQFFSDAQIKEFGQLIHSMGAPVRAKSDARSAAALHTWDVFTMSRRQDSGGNWTLEYYKNGVEQVAARSDNGAPLYLSFMAYDHDAMVCFY